MQQRPLSYHEVMEHIAPRQRNGSVREGQEVREFPLTVLPLRLVPVWTPVSGWRSAGWVAKELAGR